MILRKPYAFLIKHFRLIHLIILACLLYFLWNMNQIHSLFNRLYKAGTYSFAGSINYINYMVYVFLALLLALTIIVYVLLRKKKKPSLMYLFLILYIVVSLIETIYVFSKLSYIEEKLLTVDSLVFLTDITFVIELPCYFFIVMSFIRGIGFNLKKFNFSKDVRELDIADDDSEEFEFVIGQNNYKIKRKFRRFLRELKYYIIENKFSVVVISTSVFVVLSGIGLYGYINNAKKLKAQESTNVEGVRYQVNYSFLTAYDMTGEVVNPKHKYVVVNMSFYNEDSEAKAVNLEKIFLYDGKSSYSPTMLYNSEFYDLGVPYIKDTLIASQTSLTGTLCFEVPANTTKKNFELRIQYDINEGILNNYVAEYKKFEVKATNIDSKDTTFEMYPNDEISLDLLGVNQFNLTVTGYNLGDLYDSKYIACKDISNCNIRSTIISSRDIANDTMIEIDFDGTIYSSANFSKTLNTYNKIFDTYSEIDYTLYGKEYSVNGKSVTTTVVDNKVFLYVPRKIVNASSIRLVLNFRNNKYIYYLV